eukprot:jgi/Undpi1/7961/HiC_scaffold_24.g10433.m1
MLRRKNPDRADGKQRDTSAGKGTSTGQHQEDEEEEYPDNVDCEEYDEEDVYVMVELPTMIDTEAFTSAEAVTIKGTGSSSPVLKVGDETFDGKAEPIIGTTLAFTTPPAGSAVADGIHISIYMGTPGDGSRMSFGDHSK